MSNTNLPTPNKHKRLSERYKIKIGGNRRESRFKGGLHGEYETDVPYPYGQPPLLQRNSIHTKNSNHFLPMINIPFGKSKLA